MKKVLILGAGGQAGRELAELYPESLKVYHKSEKTGDSVDIADRSTISNLIREYCPEVVINAAALANVDLCEKNHPLAFAVNGEALRSIVEACRACGSHLVHISTDYVFDGSDGNYSEDSIPNPINYYGLSKLIGDIYALSYENSAVVRTSGVYGYNRNFPLFVLEMLENGKPVNAIDGYYSPIHANLLAKSISSLIDKNYKGIINVAGERVSRFDFANKIAEVFALDRSLITSRQNVTSMDAKRPFDSSLNLSRAKGKLDFDFHSIGANLNAFKRKLENFRK